MIKTTLNWTVKQLKNMFDNKETLSFNHPIQRQSAQWDNKQQSLLIHSLLSSYPVPNIYLEKRECVDVNDVEKKIYHYSVLDGKQRMTTIFSFINGEFALSEDIDPVTIEENTYELANRFYDELPEEVKQEILRFRFSIISFEDVTDAEIEEIFFRLNNSTPLSKPQKSKALMGVSNSIFINEILSGRFFTEKCSFSKNQLKKSDDMCTLIQAMMLLDNKYRGYEFKDISADSVMEYSKHINGNYPDEAKERLKKIIGFLDNCFYSKERCLKKINIPVLFLVADDALNKGVINSKFRTWFYSFFSYNRLEYSQYCSSGSIKKEKTLGRIRVMSESFEKFFKNLESEIPQTLNNESNNETNSDTDDESLNETLFNSNDERSLSEDLSDVDLTENNETSECQVSATEHLNDLEDATDSTKGEIVETVPIENDEEETAEEISSTVTTIGDLFNFKEFPAFAN